MAKEKFTQWTVDFAPPSEFKTDTNDPFVATMLTTIKDYQLVNEDFFSDLDTINDHILNTFRITWSELEWTFMFQIINMVLAKMIPMDVRMFNPRAWKDNNFNVNSAMKEVIEDSWFIEMMTRWDWWFFKQLTFWNFFAMMRANAISWMPEFVDWSIRNTHCDIFWTRVLSKSWMKITRLAFVWELEWNLAVSTIPWIEKVATIWRLPVTNSSAIDDQQEMSETQRMFKEKRVVQVAYCFDISDIKEPKSMIIAWPGASKVPDSVKKWKDYDFHDWKWNSKSYSPFLPLLHYISYWVWEWLLKKGPWHALLKPSKALWKMTTRFAQHVNKNMNPIQVFNQPYDETNDLARKYENAIKARANNRPPIIVNDWVNPWDISPIKIETLRTADMTVDWDRMEAELVKVARRLWFNIEIFFTDPAKTATAIITEDVNQNLAIQQIQEQNTAMSELVLKFCVSIILKNIKSNDATEFYFQAKIENENWELIDDKEPYTRWDLKETLEKWTFRYIADSRTSVYPSPILASRLRNQAAQTLLSLWGPQDVSEARRIIKDNFQDFGLMVETWAGKPASNPLSPVQDPWWEAAKTQVPDLLEWQWPTQTKDLI